MTQSDLTDLLRQKSALLVETRTGKLGTVDRLSDDGRVGIQVRGESWLRWIRIDRLVSTTRVVLIEEGGTGYE